MTKAKSKQKKVFRSLIEIEREFFPKLFSERKSKDEKVILAHTALKNVKKEIKNIQNACQI